MSAAAVNTSKRVKTEPAPTAAATARVLDLQNPRTVQNTVNKWEPYLFRSHTGMAAHILVYLDPLSGANCSRSCKQWHVLRTSNAVSRLLMSFHFTLFYAPPQNFKAPEGTYWNMYRAYGEVYSNARTFAFQPPVIIDFSKPSTPVKKDSAPPMLAAAGSFPRFLMRSSSDGIHVDAIVACHTTREVVDEVNHETTFVHQSRVQMRNYRNECYFQGEHPGKISAHATSKFESLLATGMVDGSIVLWNLQSGTKVTVIPFPPTEINGSNQPLDPALNLPPLTKAVQGIMFIGMNIMRAAYHDGTTCIWRWQWDQIARKMEYKGEATRLPDFRIIKLFSNPGHTVNAIYGRSYVTPYHHQLHIFRSQQPVETQDMGKTLLEAITFLSDTKIVYAYPREEAFRSTIKVFDLETGGCERIIKEIQSVANFAVQFNQRVLATSSYERNPTTQNTESFVSLFDLQRKEFIRHQVRSPTDFAMIPPAINESIVVIHTPSRRPHLLTVVERLSKRVFVYDFMSQASDQFFATHLFIPVKATTYVPSLSSSAAAAASGGGGGSATHRALPATAATGTRAPEQAFPAASAAAAASNKRKHQDDGKDHKEN